MVLEEGLRIRKRSREHCIFDEDEVENELYLQRESSGSDDLSTEENVDPVSTSPVVAR